MDLSPDFDLEWLAQAAPRHNQTALRAKAFQLFAEIFTPEI
jgi:hypothetical protein